MKDIYNKFICKIGLDKLLHFFVGAFIVLATGRFLHWTISVCVGLALGLAKELLDKDFNWKDLLADVIGVAVGAAILLS